MGRREINKKNPSVNLKGRDNLGDIDVDGKVRTSIVI
jgi:hypothetical protein